MCGNLTAPHTINQSIKRLLTQSFCHRQTRATSRPSVQLWHAEDFTFGARVRCDSTRTCTAVVAIVVRRPDARLRAQRTRRRRRWRWRLRRRARCRREDALQIARGIESTASEEHLVGRGCVAIHARDDAVRRHASNGVGDRVCRPARVEAAELCDRARDVWRRHCKLSNQK